MTAIRLQMKPEIQKSSMSERIIVRLVLNTRRIAMPMTAFITCFQIRSLRTLKSINADSAYHEKIKPTKIPQQFIACAIASSDIVILKYSDKVTHTRINTGIAIRPA